MTKRILSILLCIIIIFYATPIKSYAANNESMINRVSNSFVEFLVDRIDGRFVVRTDKGLSNKSSDANKNLIFEKNNDPETSYTTIRVDGEDYIYGNSYNQSGIKGGFLTAPSTNNLINTSQWHIGDIIVTQTMELINDTRSVNIGNVKISYKVLNNSNATKTIGARTLLDTMVGGNDGSPIYIGTNATPITHELSLIGEQVPTYWKTIDDVLNPSVVGFGFTSGWNNLKPDKMIIAHWSNISKSKWSYQINVSLDFTNSRNGLGTADSAVAMYWNEIELKSGDTRTFETYYGIGNFANVDSDSEFSMAVRAPSKLKLNPTKNGYEDGEFEIVAEINNALEGSMPITNARISLVTDTNIEILDGSNIKEVALIKKNTLKSVSWRVKVKPQEKFTNLTYSINMYSDNNMEIPQTVSSNLLVPGTRIAPDIQFYNVSPKNLYSKGDNRILTITGKNLDTYSNLDQWQVHLVHHDGTEYTGFETYVSGDTSNGETSTSIGVKLDKPGRHNLPVGKYQVKIVHTEFGTQTLPYQVNIVNNRKYDSHSYGVLYIEKILDGSNNWGYYIKHAESVNELKQIKENYKANPTKLVIVDIIGDVRNTGSGKYEVHVDDKPAIINGVISYSDKNNNPISIKKENGEIEIEGDGKLKVIGGQVFAPIGFGINITDGNDYITDHMVLEIDPTNPNQDFSDLGRENIQIRLLNNKYAYNSVNVASWFVSNVAGFNVEVKDAALLEKSIVFGGTTEIEFIPKTEGKVDIGGIYYSRDSNGKVGFDGINTEMEVGVGKGAVPIIPQPKSGFRAKVLIDTYDKKYKVDGRVETRLAEFHLEIGLKYDQNDTLYLDDLVFGAGPVKSGALTYKKIGGGINNLYSILREGEDSPPVTAVLEAKVSLVDIINGDFKLYTSLEGMSTFGNLWISGIGDFMTVRMSGRWNRPWYYDLTGTINIYDIIKGTVSIYLGEIEIADGIYTDYYRGIVNADITTPDSWWLVGGNTASVKLGVDSNRIWGGCKVIGIPVSVQYDYDDGFDYAIGSTGGLLTPRDSLYTTVVGMGEGKPVRVKIGRNIKVIGKSNVAYASLGLVSDPKILATIDNTEHTFNIEDQDIALLELNYDGNTPNFNLYRPDGSEYELIESDANGQNGNYRTQVIPEEESSSGSEEKKIYVSIIAPENGLWKVVADSPIESVLMDVQPLPEISSVSYETIDDDHLKINWDSRNNNNGKVDIYLAKNSDEAGIVLLSDVNVSDEVIVELPKGIEEGDYFIKAVIQNDIGFHQLLTSNTVTIMDGLKPEPVENVVVSYDGDGYLKANWNEASVTGEDETIDAYIITVYGKNGQAVAGFNNLEVNADNTSAIIGGSYTSTNEIYNETTGEVETIETTYTLQPNQEYSVGVTVRKKVGDDENYTTHFSHEARSSYTYLRQPTPPYIEFSYNDTYGITVDREGNEQKVFSVNELTLNYSTDQENVTSFITINGEPLESNFGNGSSIEIPVEDGSYKVEIACTNAYGDQSKATDTFLVDTEPAPIFLNSPVQGQLAQEGIVTVNGITESNVTLEINGKLSVVDTDGNFSYDIDLGHEPKLDITIMTVDTAGNINKKEIEVINDQIAPIDQVQIQLLSETMLTGETHQLKLVSMTPPEIVDGEEVKDESVINNEDVVWSVLEGNAIAAISEEGILEASGSGIVVLKGSYNISEDYAFEDMITLEIKDKIESIVIYPKIDKLTKGTEVQLYASLFTKWEEYTADNNDIHWDIINGQSLAQITEEGLLSGFEEGTVTINASYTDEQGNNHSDTITIDIVNEHVEVPSYTIQRKIDRVNDELDTILEAIINGNNSLENIVKVSLTPNLNKIITYNGLKVNIENDTLVESDKLLVAVISQKSIDKYPLTEQQVSLSDIYEIQLAKSNNNLKKPIEIIINYDVEVHSEDIGIYYYNHKISGWQYIGGKVDKESKTVTIDLGHLSQYMLIRSNQLIEFADIDSDRWSSINIRSLAELGIINGINDNGIYRFEPLRPITRLEFAKIMVETYEREHGETEKGDYDSLIPFTDYETIENWGKKYAIKAYKYGLIRGTMNENGETVFNPKANITRAEVATILGRIFDDKDVNHENTFIDKDKIPSWAEKSINLISSKGIITGYGDGTFKPTEDINREEAVTVIFRYLYLE